MGVSCRPSQTDDTAKNSHDSAPAPGDVIYFHVAGPDVSPQTVCVVKIEPTAYVDASENDIYTIWWPQRWETAQKLVQI